MASKVSDRITFNLCMDKELDKDIVTLLETQKNKSAYIRNILYDHLKQDSYTSSSNVDMSDTNFLLSQILSSITVLATNINSFVASQQNSNNQNALSINTKDTFNSSNVTSNMNFNKENNTTLPVNPINEDEFDIFSALGSSMESQLGGLQ